MEKIVSYPISIIYYILFLLCLLVFHPIQIICLKLFGYEAHKKSVDLLNYFLLKCTNLLGTTYSIKGKSNIPENAPIIFVSNHQSMYDIIAMIWHLRKYHVKFVSKKELGKGIPSVSYNLRHGGSALIDRKDSKQALTAIKNLGDTIQKNTHSAFIFPEGTRSKTGIPKKFSENGIKMLCGQANSAFVVPITINNSWKMVKFGTFPMGLGTKIEFIIHPAISVKKNSIEDILVQAENAVVQSIKL